MGKTQTTSANAEMRQGRVIRSRYFLDKNELHFYPFCAPPKKSINLIITLFKNKLGGNQIHEVRFVLLGNGIIFEYKIIQCQKNQTS